MIIITYEYSYFFWFLNVWKAEDADEDVADRARTILFTLNGEPKAGVVYDGFYPDKLEKPVGGFPFIK